MKANYYDPQFYISTEEMPFNIRIKTDLVEDVEPEILKSALEKTMKRYPYFKLRVVIDGEEYITVPNELPIVCYEGPEIRDLGSAEVNYHMLAVSYYGCEVSVHVSHVVCDGAGIYPLVKTLLYYYLCDAFDAPLNPRGINLAEDPLFPDEASAPYDPKILEGAENFYVPDRGDFFRLKDGGYIDDFTPTVYYVKISQKDFMRYNSISDGSPCTLGAVLAAEAIWDLHPELEKNIVCDVSLNCRGAIGTKHNFRQLCKSFPLIYKSNIKDRSTRDLCTVSRGMTMMNSQPEDALKFFAETNKLYDSVDGLSLEEKKRIVGDVALKTATENTFSISYVGQVGLGSIEPFIDSMYNITDGSTYETLFIEINAENAWFDVAFIQGFSSDAYYKAFLKALEKNKIKYREDGSEKLALPKTVLP